MSRTERIKENVVEDHLVTTVKRFGGEVRKVQWIGRRGAPDRLVMLPRCEPLWVELKRPGGKLEPHQQRELERMTDLGCRVVVIDTVEGVDVVLRGHMAPVRKIYGPEP